MTRLRPHGLAPGESRQRDALTATACRVALIGCLMAPSPAFTQQSASAGVIVGPTPTTPGQRPPGTPAGCRIVFKSPKWPGVDPGRACAARCTCVGIGPRNVSHDVLARICRNSPPTAGYGVFYDDKDGNMIPPTNAPSMPHCRCEVFAGPADPDYPQWTDYFPNGHPMCGGVVGEPHLSTFDDVNYDFQAAGEFVVARSIDDDLEVQMRLEPFDRSLDVVSIATAVAARVGDARITISSGTDVPLHIDGEPVELPDGNEIRIPATRAVILRNGRTYSVVWPDDTNLHVDVGINHIDFFVLPAESRDGRLVGVLGDADGNTENDFRTRSGRQLPAPPEFETLYADFAESWRVRPEESLFDYGPGEDTETYTLRDVPRERVTVADLDPAARTRAEERCREAGVFEPVALEQCVFDVGLTGEDAFILSALAIQTPPDFLAPTTGDAVVGTPADEPATGGSDVRIDAPDEGVAAHDIEIGVLGHQEGGLVGFHPPGSDDMGTPDTPYSFTGVTGEEETARLTVPVTPGDYELSYREPGSGRLVGRKPFRAVAPEISIQAPSTAAPGDSLVVRLAGDVGERMTVTIVPAGSPDEQFDRPFLYTEQGTEARLVLRNLPETPGDYEIRVKSDWGGMIYARRELTIR